MSQSETSLAQLKSSTGRSDTENAELKIDVERLKTDLQANAAEYDTNNQELLKRTAELVKMRGEAEELEDRTTQAEESKQEMESMLMELFQNVLSTLDPSKMEMSTEILKPFMDRVERESRGKSIVS